MINRMATDKERIEALERNVKKLFEIVTQLTGQKNNPGTPSGQVRNCVPLPGFIDPTKPRG
jgi:hypothetical protein